MKKILIKAYTQVNLGDDLFVKILCDWYPDSAFQIVGYSKYSKPFRNIKNLKYISASRLMDSVILRTGNEHTTMKLISNQLATRNDAVVHVGGLIFIQNNENWQNQIQKYRLLVEKTNNFFVIGCNFGPFQNIEFVNNHKDIFSKINDICFRDSASFELFSEVPTARIASDIVFGLDTSQIKYLYSGKYVVISVIDLTNREQLSAYSNEYENSIIEISKRLILEGYKVKLMSFCASEGDEIVIKRILNKFKSDEITYYFYRGDLEEALEILKASSGIVSSRFHSLILGWIFGKPIFPFIYSAKTSNVINDVNYQGYSLKITDIHKINYNYIINQLTSPTAFSVVHQIESSERHFSKLDQFLHGQSVIN